MPRVSIRRPEPQDEEEPRPLHVEPEDDSALARMIGVALVVGAVIWGAVVWGALSWWG